jgi:hypothetical protein
MPGVVAGAIIRVEWLSGGTAFTLVAALGSQRLPRARPTPSRHPRRRIWMLSLAVGTVGGIYGIGGGSLLAPILLAAEFSAYEVAPATLTATFHTSIAGGLRPTLCSKLRMVVPSSPTGLYRVPMRGRILRQLPRRPPPTPPPRTCAATPTRTDRLPRRSPLHANPSPVRAAQPARARSDAVTGDSGSRLSHGLSHGDLLSRKPPVSGMTLVPLPGFEPGFPP